MPKVSADHLQARRRQILDGARACFARHGYEGATVRILEEEIGLSRGAIFHHFPDKDALFLALAVRGRANRCCDTVAEHGLVQVMREMVAAPDAGRLGTQLELARRLRTDPSFRHPVGPSDVGSGTGGSRQAAAPAGRRHAPAGVDIDQLAGYLELVMEGLVAHLAAGLPADRLGGVLDLVEASVRRS